MKRMNFPGRRGHRIVAAEERNAAYAKLTLAARLARAGKKQLAKLAKGAAAELRDTPRKKGV